MEISDNIDMKEEVKAPEISRGFEAVAEVHAENDLLAEQARCYLDYNQLNLGFWCF